MKNSLFCSYLFLFCFFIQSNICVRAAQEILVVAPDMLGKQPWTPAIARRTNMIVSTVDIAAIQDALPDLTTLNSFDTFRASGFPTRARVQVCEHVVNFARSQPYIVVEQDGDDLDSYNFLNMDRYGGHIGRQCYAHYEPKVISLLAEAIDTMAPWGRFNLERYRQFIEYAGYLRCKMAAIALAMTAYKTRATYREDELLTKAGFDIGLMGQHFQQTGEFKFSDADYSFKGGMSDFLANDGKAYYVYEECTWAQALQKHVEKNMDSHAPASDETPRFFCFKGGEMLVSKKGVIESKPLSHEYSFFHTITRSPLRRYYVPADHSISPCCYSSRNDYHHWESLAGKAFEDFLRAPNTDSRRCAAIEHSRYFLYAYPFNSGTAGIDKFISTALFASETGKERQLSYLRGFRPDIAAMLSGRREFFGYCAEFTALNLMVPRGYLSNYLRFILVESDMTLQLCYQDEKTSL